MVEPFTTAARVLASAPGTEAGTLLLDGTTPVPCRFKLTEPDPRGDIGESGYRNSGTRIDVFALGLPRAPRMPGPGIVGDKITARGVTYVPVDIQRADDRGWYTFDCPTV